jgi:hypothetical protein
MITRRAFFNLGIGIFAAPFTTKEEKVQPAASLTAASISVNGLGPGTYYIYAEKAPEINEDVFLGRLESVARRSRLNY